MDHAWSIWTAMIGVKIDADAMALQVSITQHPVRTSHRGHERNDPRLVQDGRTEHDAHERLLSIRLTILNADEQPSSLSWIEPLVFSETSNDHFRQP